MPPATRGSTPDGMGLRYARNREPPLPVHRGTSSLGPPGQPSTFDCLPSRSLISEKKTWGCIVPAVYAAACCTGDSFLRTTFGLIVSTHFLRVRSHCMQKSRCNDGFSPTTFPLGLARVCVCKTDWYGTLDSCLNGNFVGDCAGRPDAIGRTFFRFMISNMPTRIGTAPDKCSGVFVS